MARVPSELKLVEQAADMARSSSNHEFPDRKLALIAIDTSEYSEYAFDWYCRYMHRPTNDVLILHCPEGFDVNKAKKEISKSGQMKENLELLYSKITELEERYHHKLHVSKMNGTVLSVPCKHAGQTIIESAREEGAFAVIMGTRSRGALSRALMGSVSEYVTKNAEIPVIVVPKKGK